MQAVIPKLLALGHDVYGVDKVFRKSHRNAGYHYKVINLTRPFEVDDHFNEYDFDYVIQAAAQVYGVGGFNQYCADIVSNDTTLHSNILNSSIRYDVKRVIFISSSMVYESVQKAINETSLEGDPDKWPAPKTDYGLSKFFNERLSLSFEKQHGLDYTIWRPFNVITPYEIAHDTPGYAHVFADFIRSIITEGKNPIPIIGDGEQVRCFTWIDEVAAAIANFSFDGKTRNEVFNLGRKEPITMKTLANLIYDAAKEAYLSDSGKLKFETVENFKNDVTIRIPNVDKAKNILGWEAIKSARWSVKQCVNEYYKNVKW